MADVYDGIIKGLQEVIEYQKGEIDLRKSDWVEVVRCKDCKYYNFQHHYCEGLGNWFGIEDEWSDNGYCYKGEREEDEID